MGTPKLQALILLNIRGKLKLLCLYHTIVGTESYKHDVNSYLRLISVNEMVNGAAIGLLFLAVYKFRVAAVVQM
jgi:hypothetical protein